MRFRLLLAALFAAVLTFTLPAKPASAQFPEPYLEMVTEDAPGYQSKITLRFYDMGTGAIPTSADFVYTGLCDHAGGYNFSIASANNIGWVDHGMTGWGRKYILTKYVQAYCFWRPVGPLYGKAHYIMFWPTLYMTWKQKTISDFSPPSNLARIASPHGDPYFL